MNDSGRYLVKDIFMLLSLSILLVGMHHGGPLASDVVVETDQTEIDPRIDPSRITVLPGEWQQTRPTGTIPSAQRVAVDGEACNMPPMQALKARRGMNKGVQWLLSNQEQGGGWGRGSGSTTTEEPDERPSPTAAAITGLGIKAIAQSGYPDMNQLAPAIDRLRMARQEDTGLIDGPLATYVVASITSALISLQDPQFDELVEDGIEKLRTYQWDSGEGLHMEQDWYGGAGYGNRGRPDLSNTQFMLDALHDAGIPSDDPAFQRAVIFVSRCQNLNSTNTAEWAGNDGGFVYTAANGGESLASEVAGNGRDGHANLKPGDRRSLRSYGSMTYAGFKSLLYAGLDSDDPRTKAALEWMRRHWTFEENPGLGQQGYYYYLYTMSRALNASGLDIIRSNNGEEHDWRVELSQALLKRQNPDGSWTNPTGRWLEGRTDLATIYAVLALEETLKPKAKTKRNSS